MSTNGIRVEEFNIYSLGAEAVSYHLKDIHTLALQVSEKNIGILALEFEVELWYANETQPGFTILAARGPKEDPEEDRSLSFRAGDWIVILWDEIHRFRDPEFRSTFSFDGLSAPQMTNEDVEQVKEYLTRDAAAAAHIADPVTPRVGLDYHAGGLFKSEGQDPKIYENSEDAPDGEFKPHIHIPISNLVQEIKTSEGFKELGEKTEIVPAVGDLEQDGGNKRPIGE